LTANFALAYIAPNLNKFGEYPLGLRKINSQDFRIATRRTSREINRRILLNLVREHQPISRADLSRRMQLARGGVSLLVNELIAEGLVYEGGTGEAARGRKPTFLHVRTHDRMVIAADVRFSRTDLMLSDFSGREIALETFSTVFSPREFVRDLAQRVRRLLKAHNATSDCEGMGLVVPGMVDHRSGRILNAPTLNWHDVDLREALASATGLPVQVENAAKACVLSQMWLARDELASNHDFAFVTVSDGVGVGIVVNGELFRGHENMAGEFGHIPLSMDGPRCLCGNLGCWEAYISNIATLSRYLGRDASKIHPRLVLESDTARLTVTDLVARARHGDARALTSIQSTARYLGLGLANVVNGLNPARVFLTGEITTAWDLIEGTVREALKERSLTEALAATRVHVASSVENPRLRGAAALVAAPTFAAIRVA
jgi:N-acetylglucosamine repressor